MRVYVRLILVLVLRRQIVYGQNTVYLCLSKYIVFESHTAVQASCGEKHSTEWRLPTWCPKPKPHGQQQLARDLEVERAVMGQRCRPQSFGEVQRYLYSSSTSNERTEEMGIFLWLIDF